MSTLKVGPVGIAVGTREIILLGGSGDVGSRLAMILLENTDAVVTVVSRRARGNVDQFGDRLQHLSFDLSGSEELATSSNAIVVNLSEATRPSLARQVVESGGWFLESSATPDYLNAITHVFDGVAGPGIAILCVGAAPGLTNLMAAEIANKVPDTVKIDIGVEMGMGRHYGAAATEWFLRAAGQAYPVVIDHEMREIAPGQIAREFAFKEGHPVRRSIGYGFAEQVVIAQREDRRLKTVRSFVAIDPAWVTRVFAIMLTLGLGPTIGRNARSLAKWLRRMPEFGRSKSRLMLEGFDDAGHMTGRIRLESGDQADVTAAMIFATVQRILERSAPERRGLTTITDHLDFDAALAVLQRFLPETRVTESFGNYFGNQNEADA